MAHKTNPKRLAANGPRQCAFCGRVGPLTQEHMWPDWLKTVFPDLGPPTHRFGLVGDDASWVEERRPAFSRRAKIVCAECNNGWKSRLEIAAAPLISPMLTAERKVTLNADEQATVALWVVKTAMTIQLSHPTRRIIGIPNDHYRSVNRDRHPPETTQVWIGGCTHDDRPPNVPLALVGRCRIAPLSRFRPDDIAPEEPTRAAYSATMSLGNLAMQIFGHQYSNSRVQLRYPELSGTALLQIWPIQTITVNWPGALTIDYPTFDALTSVLGELI
jgi:hypothetical protein